MKRILITGENSYVGTSFRSFIEEKHNEDYIIDELSVKGDEWKKEDFSKYDVVFHVAGIAHIKETKENQQLYFDINRDIAFEIARKSKDDGISQFVFMSSMSVYGIDTGIISKDTKLNPKSAYGQSKLEAEQLLKELEGKSFRIAILRPPMIYGPNCKGNYQLLSKFARKSPVFPKIKNQRSMIFIDNLSIFVEKIIQNELHGLFFPQNEEYVTTYELVENIAKIHGNKIHLVTFFNPLLRLMEKTSLIQKVFGNLIYDLTCEVNNCTLPFIPFSKSIYLTEKKKGF